MLARDGHLWIQQGRSIPSLQLWPRGLTLIVAQSQTGCTRFLRSIARERMLKQISRLRRGPMRLKWGAEGVRECLKYHLGGFSRPY